MESTAPLAHRLARIEAALAAQESGVASLQAKLDAALAAQPALRHYLDAASSERDVVSGGGDAGAPAAAPTPEQLAVLEGRADDLLRARALAELVHDKGALLLQERGGGPSGSVNAALEHRERLAALAGRVAAQAAAADDVRRATNDALREYAALVEAKTTTAQPGGGGGGGTGAVAAR